MTWSILSQILLTKCIPVSNDPDMMDENETICYKMTQELLLTECLSILISIN